MTLDHLEGCNALWNGMFQVISGCILEMVRYRAKVTINQSLIGSGIHPVRLDGNHWFWMTLRVVMCIFQRKTGHISETVRDTA